MEKETVKLAQINVNPTRMELKKLRARYDTARRGHKLLKDKRDELMRRFAEVVREDKELRARVEESLSRVYGSFSVAAAVMSPEMLDEALMLCGGESELEIKNADIMSVTVPRIVSPVKRASDESDMSYGMAFTSGELDAAVGELGAISKDLLRMAELEKTAMLLSGEIERTRRRVNALEYIMMPQYLEGMRTIRMKLEENERGNLTRLMKVKDMMLEKKTNADEDENG